MKTTLVAVLPTLCLLGCAHPQAQHRPSPADAAALMEADRVFDRDTARDGVRAWAAAFAPDGMMLPAEGPNLVGRAAIGAFMGPVLGQPGASLRWQPEGAFVSQSGDLGYTWGHSVGRWPQPDGRVVETRGKYLTVWRRQLDGSWKAAADIGNTRRAPRP